MRAEWTVAGHRVPDPAAWPVPVQGLCCLMAFGAVWALAWVMGLGRLQAQWEAQRQREAVLQAQHTALRQRIEAQPQAADDSLVAEASPPQPAHGGPDAQGPREVWAMMLTAGQARELSLEWFRPDPAPVAEKRAVWGGSVRVLGRYHDIAGWLRDVSNRPCGVTIHDLKLRAATAVPAAPGTPPVLALEATLRMPEAPASTSTSAPARDCGSSPTGPAMPQQAPWAGDHGIAPRDPFVASWMVPTAAVAAAGSGADRPRAVPLLERRALQDMELVGVIDRGGEPWALLRVQGTVQAARTGQRLGVQGGTIERIEEHAVTTVEASRDAHGRAVSVTSTLHLKGPHP